MAHTATLDNKGKTIAVLGNGLSKIFPKENIDLYKRIIKEGGLAISEYAPNEDASSNKFLERNRIVSGISMGVLVIEAKHRSGTSVTARLAKEQNKKIFAIPHELNNINGKGTNRLIKEGTAKLVTTPEDIIKELRKTIKKYKIILNKNPFNCKYYNKITNSVKKKIKVNLQIKNKRKKHNENYKSILVSIKKFKIEKAKRYKRQINIPKGIKEKEYQEIYKIILKNPKNIDIIYKKSINTVGEINQILLMLEIEGYIKKTAGGYVCTQKKN